MNKIAGRDYNETHIYNSPDLWLRISESVGDGRVTVWSNVPLASVAEVWGCKTGVVSVACNPGRIGDLSHALLRLCAHNPRIRLGVTNTQMWLTIAETHFKSLPCLGAFVPSTAGTAGLDSSFPLNLCRHVDMPSFPGIETRDVEYDASDLAEILNTYFDLYLFRVLQHRLDDGFSSPDQGRQIFGVYLDPALSKLLRQRWHEWLGVLKSNKDIEGHFFLMLFSTHKSIDSSCWRTRIGIATLDSIMVPSILFALALDVALCAEWLPARQNEYENLCNSLSYGAHLFALTHINRTPITQIDSLDHWIAKLVLLPGCNLDSQTFVNLSRKLGRNLTVPLKVDSQSGRNQCFITKDGTFDRALLGGLDELQIWLNAKRKQWQTESEAVMAASVERGKEV